MIFHIIPGTRVIAVLHPMPIRAFFFVVTTKHSAVAKKVNRRLPMGTAFVVTFPFRTPFAKIAIVVDLKSKSVREIFGISRL